MTEKSGSFQIAWIQGAISPGMVLFVVFAGKEILENPSLRNDQFFPSLIILVAAAAFSRKFGISLPGKGFASFLFAAVWAGLFLQHMYFAILVAFLGTTAGDLIFRQLRFRSVFNNIGHIVLGTGLVGLLYGAAGGQHGAAAIGADNLGPMLVAIFTLPAIVNGTFYLEHALSNGVAWADAKLTIRWEVAITFFSAAIALSSVALVTAQLDTVSRIVWGLLLMPGIGIALLVVKQAVAADELRLVQGMADAVATDVSIDRSFARIQELTKLLLPWEQMGFARYDAKAGEMELLADTGTTERLRFPVNTGLTGEAIRSGEAIISNAVNRNEMIVPDGEKPGSEVLIPLYHGGRLVGLWSIRHSDATMYRSADATLLKALAPQLALALALSEILTPMRESSEHAASSMRQIREAHHAIRESARTVEQVVGKAKDESNRAARRVHSASETIRRLSDGIDGALSSARSTVQVIRATADEAADLRQATGDTVSQLRELSTTIQQGTVDVAKLRDAATEVEGFSQAIGGIANQTNLLALNATIESARAGVHGKGFRVVAEEVRKLADESGRAARNIGRSAQKTRRVIDNSAQLLEGLERRLTELASASELWGTRLAAIVETVEKSKRAGEQMVRFPEENRKAADDALQTLQQAEAAAAAAAEQAMIVANSGSEQLQGIEQLSQGLEKLTRFTEQLEEGARFVSGNGNGDQ